MQPIVKITGRPTFSLALADIVIKKQGTLFNKHTFASWKLGILSLDFKLCNLPSEGSSCCCTNRKKATAAFELYCLTLNDKDICQSIPNLRLCECVAVCVCVLVYVCVFVAGRKYNEHITAVSARGCWLACKQWQAEI